MSLPPEDDLHPDWMDLCCDECLGEGCERCSGTGYDPVRHPHEVECCLTPSPERPDPDDYLAGCCPDCGGEGDLAGCQTCSGTGYAPTGA